ncbi:MAG: DUF3068 domain-containing protein, partial [Micromonosporaceae bacterium]|nr:DUF3068 domain-containing protein [Micromonosporaceae bacterium]
MRRVIGFTLISLAAFALALGLMLRFYAYPNLARAELGGYTESIAEGSGLTVFNPDAIKDPDIPAERHNVNLIATRAVKGITTAPEAKPHGDVMVWEVGTVVMDRDNPDPNKPISVTQDRLCLDRRTNEAVHPCRNEYFKDPGRAEENQEFRGEHKGQNYKFPFGAEARDHKYFDTTLRRALPIKHVGEESVDGLLTYKFEQKVSRVKIEEREAP